MKCQKIRLLRLSLVTILLSGGLALAGLSGCSSAVKKVEFDASANPNEEVHRMDQDVNDGYARHDDVLANEDFTEALSRLDKAKNQLAQNEKPERVLNTLGYARAYLNLANDQSAQLFERTKGILEARTAALNAGVRLYPATQSDLKTQDDDLRDEISNIKKGQLTPARWSALQRGYLNLELRAVQETKLGQAKALVYGAIQNGAKKNTPNMLTQAERDIKNAENVIAVDRHDETNFRPAVERANASANLLAAVLATTKRPEGVINEDAARDLVMSNRKVSQLNQQLGEVSKELGESTTTAKEQGRQLNAAGLTLALNKALESARKEFNPDEADVYREGDKLLIRLKAVNFPTGKSDLPTHSLPLLAKVKAVAEDLHPQQILVEGHTDSTGNPATNKALSQDRAQAVATYLESNGIASDKLQAVGAGIDKPLATNTTKEGRAQNRRVDVIITPEVPAEGGAKAL